MPRGAAYGAQWTLFRQAIAAGRAAAGLGQPADLDGPCRGDISAIRIAIGETFARGGVGQAGVEAKPFHAWIDAWEMRGLDGLTRRHAGAA